MAMLRQEVDELRRRLADAQRQCDSEMMGRQKVKGSQQSRCVAVDLPCGGYSFLTLACVPLTNVSRCCVLGYLRYWEILLLSLTMKIYFIIKYFKQWLIRAWKELFVSHVASMWSSC